MSTLTKNTTKKMRRHVIGPNAKPLCGGGYGGKSSSYQVDFGDDTDCKACLKIQSNLATKNQQEK